MVQTSRAHPSKAGLAKPIATAFSSAHRSKAGSAQQSADVFSRTQRSLAQNSVTEQSRRSAAKLSLAIRSHTLNCPDEHYKAKQAQSSVADPNRSALSKS